MSAPKAAVILVLAMALKVPAAELTAAEVSQKSRETGAMALVGARAELVLSIVDEGGGAARDRALTAVALESAGETRRLVRFRSPAEVAGVGFLSVEKSGAPTERYLYLPSQRRVRRVAQSQGGQSFMGTDFAYVDLDLGGGGEEKLERLPDARVEGNDCYVLSGVLAGSPYGKVVSHVHQQTFVPLQVAFFSPEGVLLKTLTVKRVKQIKGRWVAMESEMKTVKGSRTSYTITALEMDAKIDPEELTERALAR